MTTLALFLFLSITDPEATLMAFPREPDLYPALHRDRVQAVFQLLLFKQRSTLLVGDLHGKAPGLGHPLDLQALPLLGGSQTVLHPAIKVLILGRPMVSIYRLGIHELYSRAAAPAAQQTDAQHPQDQHQYRPAQKSPAGKFFF